MPVGGTERIDDIVNTLDSLLGNLLLISGMWMVGLSAISTKLTLYALQTVAVGVLAILVGIAHHETALIMAGAGVLVLKGIAAPLYLSYLTHVVGCRKDVGSLLASPLLLLVCAAAVGGLYLFHPFRASVPPGALPAIGVILVGMILMVSRRLAISQIIGFLVLENGMFYFTVTIPHSLPLLVELGVLLDIMAGTMIAGVLTFQISDSFEHIDILRLNHPRK